MNRTIAFCVQLAAFVSLGSALGAALPTGLMLTSDESYDPDGAIRNRISA
jgi:hypothetical protein